jgi:hypothetical protein
MKKITQLELLNGTRHKVHKPTRSFKNKKRTERADTTGRKAKHKGKET